MAKGLRCLVALALAWGSGHALAWQGSSFKKPSPEVLRRTLTKIQYHVTQNEGTEPPFRNDFYNHKQPGIYVDVVSGEPLFSSSDKFDSGTGWPSFTRPLSPEFIRTREDRSLGSLRLEVRSRYADSHLGHVFDDGPKPEGKRYCINSAAMRFVPAAKLNRAGYGQYVHLFGNQKETPTLRGPVTPTPETLGTAVFAGGCFWCMEPPFEKLDGVVSVVSGFMGGQRPDPTYEQVSAGGTGYAEVVEVRYLSARVSYKRLLEVFWENIDPTAENRQFCDVGDQYRSAIFFADKDQETLARKSRARIVEAFRKAKPESTIYTEVVAAGPFYPAGPEHQDFYKTNPTRYKEYRAGCGRDRRLHEIWSGVTRFLSGAQGGR